MHEKVRESRFPPVFLNGYAKRFQNQHTSGYNVVLLFSAGLLVVATLP